MLYQVIPTVSTESGLSYIEASDAYEAAFKWADAYAKRTHRNVWLRRLSPEDPGDRFLVTDSKDDSHRLLVYEATSDEAVSRHLDEMELRYGTQ
jgi:hypothetical protein